MKLTRRNQLWIYVSLSALTALCQYVIQGAMASGHDPAQFPVEFWIADYGLWGARALIEAGVIVYLFSTSATTRTQGAILAAFEFALIALITPTVGFALRGLGYGLLTREMLPEPWLTLWFLGIGAYTSLMMGAAGFAYKVQPDDEAQADHAAELAALQQALDTVKATLAAAQHFESLPPQLRTRWIVANRNGEGPTNKEIAEREGVHPSQIGRWTKAQ